MIDTTLEQEACTVLCHFKNSDKLYESSDIGQFYTEMSRLYNAAVNSLNRHQITDLKQTFNSQFELDSAVELVLSDLDIAARHTIFGEDGSEYFNFHTRKKPDLRALVNENHPAKANSYNLSLQIKSINYNSPLRTELIGLAKPLLVVLAITGGKVDLFAMNVEMPGLVESVIKIHDAFISEQNSIKAMEKKYEILSGKMKDLTNKMAEANKISQSRKAKGDQEES